MSNAVMHIPSGADTYRAALEGLARLDEVIMSSGAIPPLYEAGVRYKKEPQDTWRHAGEVAASGWGDCEDLAAYRVAELRITGEDPGATVDTYQTGPKRFHAVVRRSRGIIPPEARGRHGFEDPSRACGMKPGSETVGLDALRERKFSLNRRSVMSRCAAVMGEDVSPEYRSISFDLVRLPSGGWSGIVRIPFKDGTALYMKPSTSQAKANAARKSVNLAKLASKNPAVNAAMPPQAQLAAKVLTSPAAGKAVKALGRFGRL
jgi:hypothetical protein